MKTSKRKATSVEVDEFEMRRRVNELHRQRKEFDAFCKRKHQHAVWWRLYRSLRKAEEKFSALIPASLEAFAVKAAYASSRHWDFEAPVGWIADDADRLLIKQARRSGHRLHAVA